MQLSSAKDHELENTAYRAQAQNKKKMDSEQLTTKEACIAENKDETLQVTKCLQSPEVEPYIKSQP